MNDNNFDDRLIRFRELQHLTGISGRSVLRRLI